MRPILLLEAERVIAADVELYADNGGFDAFVPSVCYQRQSVLTALKNFATFYQVDIQWFADPERDQIDPVYYADIFHLPAWRGYPLPEGSCQEDELIAMAQRTPRKIAWVTSKALDSIAPDPTEYGILVVSTFYTGTLTHKHLREILDHFLE